jgi:hypothetical protein
MNISLGSSPQVTYAPRCPEFDAANTAIVRSKRLTLEHQGEQCMAQQQYRKCRECLKSFGVIHVKGAVRRKRRR